MKSGIEFYFHLRYNLIPSSYLSDESKYPFIQWTKFGELEYEVENNSKKRIPAEIIVMSKFWNDKGIKIDYDLLNENKHNHYCTPHVLNYLLKTYN
jgi:hypothetical protein